MSGLLETEVREGFMRTGTPKMLCCKHGDSRVRLSLSGLSVDEFQDLPIQFVQVLKAKIFNRRGILLIGLGDSTNQSMK